VVDYVLKYNYRSDLIPALVRACRIINLKKEEDYRKFFEQYVKETELLCKFCFNGNDGDTLRNNNFFLRLEINFFLVFLLSSELNKKYLFQRPESMQVEVSKMLARKYKQYIMDIDNKRCIILGSSEKEFLQIPVADDKIKKITDIFLEKGTDIKIGCSAITAGMEHLSNAYQEALASLSICERNSGKTIVYYDEIRSSEKIPIIVLQRAIDYIENNYADKNISLEKISKEVFFSPPYFSTVFKQYTGMNLSAFIRSVRLRHVRELLEKTNLKIFEIAELTGYNSPQYLSRLFMRIEGFSPNGFRRKMHKKNHTSN
ncbi:MAG: AraC family transcriptional regulator, partial [Treponema sp.]|nr:AraC family transcriptional regulator [Treponema sp.]